MARKPVKADLRRSLLDAIADRVAVTDLQGVIRDVNQAMVDFQGRPREQIIGRRFMDLVAPADRERIWECFQETIDRGFSAPCEYRSLSPSGAATHSEVKALVIRDGRGRPTEALAVIRDVTHRKEIESQLAENEEMLRSLLDNVHEAVYQIDADGIIRFISAGIERVVGFGPEEVVGRSFMEFIYPEDRDFIREEFQRLAQNLMRPSEYRVVHKSGEVRWISSSSRPVFVEGRFSGISGILTDIHERKVAQEALERQQELLRQAQKMEAIGTLAGGIAHDFNNLLMGIQGRVSLMLMDSDSGQPHADHLRGIQEHVQSATELTRQLLGLARGGRYEAKPSDLNALIRRTLDMFGRTRKEIVIDARLEPRLWTVEIDRAQIEQVLLNLLVNAWQAMPQGGPLAVESRNLEVGGEDARSFQLLPGRYVRMGVSDSGVGMDEETRSRIFDPFFTTKEMGRGTGLGLASAYGIVKNHGGVITVYSQKGSGSTFHVYLPATEKAVEAPVEKPAEVAGGSETILLVDDESQILEVSRQMLESLGYRVLAAASGAQALAVFQRQRGEIAMVILDMIMPQMSGGRVFEALRELDPGLRVLLSSGYSINGQALEIMRRGCSGFIQKPFTVTELARKVREVLEA